MKKIRVALMAVTVAMLLSVGLSGFVSTGKAQSQPYLPPCPEGWYYSVYDEECGLPCCRREVVYHCESTNVLIICRGLTCQNPNKLNCHQLGGE